MKVIQIDPNIKLERKIKTFLIFSHITDYEKSVVFRHIYLPFIFTGFLYDTTA